MFKNLDTVKYKPYITVEILTVPRDQGKLICMSLSERKHKMAKKRKVAKKKKAVKKKSKKKKAAKKKKAPKGLWSKADINLLKKLFPTNPTSKIAKQLKRKTDAVKKKASRMGLRKSKRYLKSIGRA
ncbi:MAG: hypothetical protein GWO38_30805 [Phycisphaerae bacterium]|nr:hypothetical protein [Phycisphaerae bacterium]NIX31898.1 hypothetical protein [Phycisphaerae bacterium]